MKKFGNKCKLSILLQRHWKTNHRNGMAMRIEGTNNVDAKRRPEEGTEEYKH